MGIAWALHGITKHVLLIAAGVKGVIRIIDTCTNEFRNLKGHSLAINDLKIHPKHTDILLSASKDDSLGLCNLQTDVCIAVFGGVEGHRDEVLSADLHWKAHKMVSCGMDDSLKIWSLEGDEVTVRPLIRQFIIHTVLSSVHFTPTYSHLIVSIHLRIYFGHPRTLNYFHCCC